MKPWTSESMASLVARLRVLDAPKASCQQEGLTLVNVCDRGRSSQAFDDCCKVFILCILLLFWANNVGPHLDRDSRLARWSSKSKTVAVSFIVVLQKPTQLRSFSGWSFSVAPVLRLDA